MLLVTSFPVWGRFSLNCCPVVASPVFSLSPFRIKCLRSTGHTQLISSGKLKKENQSMEDFCASAVLNVQQDTPEMESSSGWKKGSVTFGRLSGHL